MKGMWKYRLAVAGVFVAGLLCGGALMLVYKKRQDRELYRTSDTVAQVVVRHLGTELDLSEGQEKEIVAAVNNARTELLVVLKEMLPELLGVAGRCVARIRNCLDDRQKAAFDRILAERRRNLQDLLWALPARKPAGGLPDGGARP